MDMTEIRRWFEQVRTEAAQKMITHYIKAQVYLTKGNTTLAYFELCWAREIRTDWKFYDVKLP